jgi:FkbM family methyltransferase
MFRNFFKSAAARPHALNYILASNKYGAYCVPAAAMHRPAAKHVMAGKVWEDDTVEFMVTHCADGDVITAGAFFGDFLPALSSALRPHRTVWAFEPNPENYRCAAITVLLNDLKNVTLTNAALGARSETRRLVVRDFTGRALGGASQIIDVVDGEGTRGTDTVAIDVIAIDDLVPSDAKVSLVQLDIEGFEEWALVGAAKTIGRNRPLLILETVPKPESPAGRFMASMGYRVTRPLSSENVLLQCD